jgi:predicted Zn-dependent protease
MAPERFRGDGDGRADVYSLGLTLYELLALRPAFDSPDRLQLIEQIKVEDPPRPRALDPQIPRDLETIVLKAIAKNPQGRYPSADALGEDLRRFLADEPIKARRVGPLERAWIWAKRRPAAAALLLASAVAALALVGVGVAFIYNRRLEAKNVHFANTSAETDRALATAEQACRLAPDRQAYRIGLGVALYRAGRCQDAIKTLKGADQPNTRSPTVLAVLTLAHHRLGQREHACDDLSRLRELKRQPEQAPNEEARAFPREVEAAEQDLAFPIHPFAC